LRLACVQAHVAFGDPAANVESLRRTLRDLKTRGVDLAVFPECFLTGYCFRSREEALEGAIRRDDPALARIVACVDELDAGAIVGFAETDGERVYNTAALFEPGEAPWFYRKTHLPELGLDKFVTPGEDLPVFDTRWGKIGILICFDQRQPEAARVLAMKGAELIALPTNWPEGAENSAEVMCVARAAENRVFYAACNRAGEERTFRFIGRSKIIAPNGAILAAAGAEEETLVCDLDLSEARQKRAVVRPGEYEWTIFDSRRPELYEALTEPAKAPR